jgi:PKD repeat protein
MSITQGTAPLTLAFTNTSTGDGLEYYWDFGDGNTSTLKNPTHTFVNPNVYSVTLTVTNANGTNQASQTISATAAGGGGGYGGGNGGNGDQGGGNGGGNGGGGGGCFIAGTLIQLPSSTIAIEYIKVGDVVKSFDVGTSSVVNSKVTETFVHSDRYYMIINGTIKTTSVHPFYSDGNWIEAGDLSIGDKILHVDGLEHTIETIELSDEPVTVYNFEVDGTHNYFAEGYLVHNKLPPMDPGF